MLLLTFICMYYMLKLDIFRTELGNVLQTQMFFCHILIEIFNFFISIHTYICMYTYSK